MIRKLTLENFKKHASLELVLDQGLNALIGENAEGKSTVLKGINYALFGVTQNGSKPHLTRRGADSHKVVLDIDLQGTTHRIERTPRSAKVYRGVDLVASGTTATSAFIEESLGMSAKDYLMLTYSPQGEPRMLLAMGATALQRKIEELSHSEIIDKVLELIGKDQRGVEVELAALEGSSLMETPLIEQSVEAHRAEYLNTEAQQADLERQVQAVQAERGQQEQHLTQLTDQITAVQRLRDQREALQQQMAREQASKPPTDITPEEMQAADDYCKTLQNLHQETLDSLQELQRQHVQNTQLYRQITQALEDLPRLEEKARISRQALDQIATCKTTLAEMDQALAVHNTEYGHCMDEWRKAKESVAGAFCHTCQRPFDADEHQKAQERLDQLNQSLQQQQATLKPLSDHRDYLLSEMAQWRRQVDDQAEPALVALQATLKLHEAQYEALPKLNPADMSRLTEERDKRYAEQQRALRIYQDLQAAYTRQVWVNQQLAEWQEKVDALTQTLEGHNSLEDLVARQAGCRDALKSLREHHVVLSDTWNKVTLQRQMLHHTLKTLTNELEAAQARDEKLALLRDQAAQLSRLKTLLILRRATWIQDTWDGLLRHASFWLTSISPLSDLRRTDSGDFFVTEDGAAVPVSELSGAQSAMVGICLRLALSRVFYGKGCSLLLDEPSADCSDANAARMAGLLRGLGQQVLLVSHRGGDVQQADQVLSF